jgi:hypothetical protein
MEKTLVGMIYKIDSDPRRPVRRHIQVAMEEFEKNNLSRIGGTPKVEAYTPLRPPITGFIRRAA